MSPQTAPQVAAAGPPGTSGGAPPAAPSRFRRPQVDKQVAVTWLLFLIVIPASRIASENFPSGSMLDAIVTLSLFLVVIAFGQGLVILTGGIDLSVAAVAATAAYACAYFVSSGTAPLLAILLGLGIALVIGLVNGLGVAFLKIPPFIMTLAVSTITASALLGFNSGRPARPAPEVLPKLFGEGADVGGLPVTLFFLIGVVAAGFAIQGLTSYGRRVYAIGSTQRAAEISGVRVPMTLASVYVVAALFYGIGGMMLLGFSGNARLELGREYLLPSIAAVLVGGTAIKGGRGSFLGTVGGALLLTAISVDISAADLAEGWKQVLYGAIVLATLMLARAAGLGLRNPFAGRGSRAAAARPVPARE
jgi:ribose transport system permease protein